MRGKVARRIHPWIGICLFLFLMNSAITGALRANSNGYWAGGYKQKKQVATDPPLSPPTISIDQVFTIAKKEGIGSGELQSILLKKDFGRLLYQVEGERGTTKWVIDAATGQVLSPLNEELVRAAAYQYVTGQPEIKEITKLKDYKSRKERDTRDVYRVRFNDRSHTEIFLDADTGEIVEDLNDQRRLALLVVKLHDLDFGGLGRYLLSFVGTSFILLAFSGLYLWLSGRPWLFLQRSRKRSQPL